jgi:hypothetical protein
MSQEAGMADAGVTVPAGPVRHWRIHLGAHKTATTHLQETLTLVRPALAARGLDYIPNSLLRQQKFARTLWYRDRLARMPLLGPARMREKIVAVVEPLRLGPETVVLSEENILGVSDQMLQAPFYPQAALSIRRLATLTAQAEVVFFLSIRSYDRLLPSAYAEALKFRPPPPGGFDVARLLARPPSWHDLVRQIRTAAPGVSLRVWQQEDYRANAQAIMTEVCGTDLGLLPDISDPSWTRSPTAEGIRAAEAIDPGLDMRARREKVRELYDAAEGAPYRPFTDAERADLKARYAADLAGIEADFPGTLMRFPA